MPVVCVKKFVMNIDGKSEKINSPDMLVRLPPCTFRGLRLVKQFNINMRLTHIGERAFQDCLDLQTINLPDTLERIECGAFANCKSLAETHLPDNVTHIGDCAFVNCALRKIVLPKRLRVLGFNVFRGCRSLESVTLPDGIKVIKLSDKWFENCDSLKEISVCADCVIESGALPENCRVIYRSIVMEQQTENKKIPRYRTIGECVAEIKKIDRDTAVTAYYIRTLCRDGEILHFMNGSKSLVNLDYLLAYLAEK